MSANQLTVRLADLQSKSDQQALLDLLDMYSRDPLGDDAPLAPDVRQRLIPDLQRLEQCRAFLAFHNTRPIGLAICFLGYSSFQGRPLLNIHDLAVSPEMRPQGVGRALLQSSESEARRCGCCRLTLEVRADNAVARRLYEDVGFHPGNPASDALSFWKKSLA